mmetsp:Transcript_7505/g.15320  ORF Transcript_7505/g.15320 Transcript_7505/m.15320 type:complete len:528 (+) Transcript_7505:208-1791(+)
MHFQKPRLIPYPNLSQNLSFVRYSHNSSSVHIEKMKIALALLSSLLVSQAKGESSGHEDDCTHGKLYVLDDTSSDVHVIDVSEGTLESLTVETTVSLPSAGAGQLVYYGVAGDPLVVQYRGQAGLGYQDGYVRFIDTGFSFDDHNGHGHVEYSSPAVYENAKLDDCAFAVHQVRHDNKVAIFCDGSYNFDPQVNTTVHVVDETKLGSSTESAIILSKTLEGTHHGVAIPVDDGHLLHSLAHPDRIDRVNGTTSLPATFQVVDNDGGVLHELSNTSNPDTHCSGFHGSAARDNTFALACDAVHGGIVIVDYDGQGSTYTSRALSYPQDDKYESFRIGSFAYHKKNSYFVGSYSIRFGTEFHLVAIDPSSSALEEANILTLPTTTSQCAYQFEVGKGEHLLVFMPNGVLHAFEIVDGSFNEVAKKEIVAGMTTCAEASFVAGIGQAFVATKATKTIYAVDLAHLEDGEMDVYESTLSFTPTAMTVSGFTPEAACEMKHEHENETSGVDSVVSMVTASVLAMACVFVLSW